MSVHVVGLLGLEVTGNEAMPHAYLLAALILVPVLVYAAAKRLGTEHTAGIVGVAFGAIVSPWAAGLYTFYFASPWGLIPGMVGLVLELIHGVPGFKIALYLGLVPRGVVSGFRSEVIIESINGLFWAMVYGLVGSIMDRLRRRRTRLNAK